MNRFILSAAAAAAAIAAVAPQASAQSYNPFQIGASGGIAFPTSDLGNVANTGYNIAVAVGYKPLAMPIGLRAEAAYNEFGVQGGGGNISIPAFTANATFELPAAGFKPYVIGGAGLYRPGASSSLGTSNVENKFGFNIGGGVKIPLTSSFETFVEARYHRVSMGNGDPNLSFVPVTIGIMF